LTPRDYLLREYKSGVSARAAGSINRPFHDAVWANLSVRPLDALSVLSRLLLPAARQTLQLLESWTATSPHRPTRDELTAVYLAHLPLKRMMFLQGYGGEPFEELWDALRSG
jgi:hypothetical protein